MKTKDSYQKIQQTFMVLAMIIAVMLTACGGPVEQETPDAIDPPETEQVAADPVLKVSGEVEEPEDEEPDSTEPEDEDSAEDGQDAEAEESGSEEQDSGNAGAEVEDQPEEKPEPVKAQEPEKKVEAEQPVTTVDNSSQGGSLTVPDSDSFYQYIGMDGDYHDAGNGDLDMNDPYVGLPGYEGPKEGYEFNVVRGYYKKDEVTSNWEQIFEESEENGLRYYDYNAHTRAWKEQGEENYDFKKWVEENMDYVMDYCERNGITYQRYLEDNHIA